MQFSPIAININSLRSTVVRRDIGARVFSLALETQESSDGIIRFFGGLLGGLSRFIGFVSSALLKLVAVPFSVVWGVIQEFSYTLVFFDWNQSDQAIKDQIRANNIAMAQMLGRFAGSGIVRIASVGIAAGISLKYPVVAGRIALELARESGDEIRGEFIGMIQGCRTLALENFLLAQVLGMRQRRWFGQQPRPDDGPVDSFATRIETQVQSIDNELLRAFVMGLLEGSEDAFWDTGYIVAQTLDDVVAANRYTNNNAMGPDRVVRIEPDTTSDEAIVLAGPQQLIKQSIDQTLATYQLVHNRDVGQIVGIPAESFPRAKHQLRSLVIVFRSKSRPPWYDENGRSKEIQYTVPDAKPGLSWTEIKRAARPFVWGPWRCTANLDNNRQMAVYGSNANEAEQQLRSLLALTTANIVTLSTTEERIRDARYIKHPTPVWPCYATIVTHPTDSEQRSGVQTRRSRRRIKLWPDSEPDDYGALA